MMLVATAAAIFTSCSNSEVVDLATGRAIGFETYVGKSTTRGVPVEKTLFDDGYTMRVWGFYGDAKLDATWVSPIAVLPNLDGATVTKNGNAWTYAPAAYWKDKKAHSFFACAPSIADTDGVEFKEGKFTYTVQDQVEDQVDFMVADALKNEPCDLTTTEPTDQKFTFRHALSQIKYSARISKAPDAGKATDIQITGVTMQVLDATDAAFTTFATTGVINIIGKTDANAITYEGNPTGTCGSYVVTPDAPVVPNIVTDDNTNPDYLPIAHNAADVLMLMPQTTVGKVKFTLALSYTNDKTERVTAEAIFITTAAQTWEPNKKYTYKFNIDMPKVMDQRTIVFDEPDVVVWAEGTGHDGELDYQEP